jgi:hypothetical protein
MSDHQEIWCQPADQPKRQFIIMFDDPQMDVAVFDNEEEARAYWEKANLNWTCYLMGTLPRASSQPAGSTALLRRMSDLLDNLSPDETIGFTNGPWWIDVATVAEIRKAAYPPHPHSSNS